MSKFGKGDVLVSSRGATVTIVSGPHKGNNGNLYLTLDDEGNHELRHAALLETYDGERKDEKE